MKFVYVDESGNSDADRFLVFFALQVDAYRLKRATTAARPLFAAVAKAHGGPLRELKASRLVNGKDGWRAVAATDRVRLFRELCLYPPTVGADAFCLVIDRDRYRAAACAGHPAWRRSPWLAAATAIALLVQRTNQDLKKNKGLSVLIFDDNKMELPKLSEFLVNSSPDADEYYGRGRGTEPFDHVVDTAFAIRSEHSHLVQIADACAYAVRRRAELSVGGQAESWCGERAMFDAAVASLASRVLFPSKTWVAKPHCEAAEWLRDTSLVDLPTWLGT